MLRLSRKFLDWRTASCLRTRLATSSTSVGALTSWTTLVRSRSGQPRLDRRTANLLPGHALGAMPARVAIMLKTALERVGHGPRREGACDRGSSTGVWRGGDAAGARPARRPLHGRRHDRVRDVERDLEVAGGHLSGR